MSVLSCENHGKISLAKHAEVQNLDCVSCPPELRPKNHAGADAPPRLALRDEARRRRSLLVRQERPEATSDGIVRRVACFAGGCVAPRRLLTMFDVRACRWLGGRGVLAWPGRAWFMRPPALTAAAQRRMRSGRDS